MTRYRVTVISNGDSQWSDARCEADNLLSSQSRIKWGYATAIFPLSFLVANPRVSTRATRLKLHTVHFFVHFLVLLHSRPVARNFCLFFQFRQRCPCHTTDQQTQNHNTQYSHSILDIEMYTVPDISELKRDRTVPYHRMHKRRGECNTLSMIRRARFKSMGCNSVFLDTRVGLPVILTLNVAFSVHVLDRSRWLNRRLAIFINERIDRESVN